MARLKVTGEYAGKIDKDGYLAKIGLLHNKVHEGKLFLYSHYDTNVDIADPKYYLFKTHANYAIHMTGIFKSSKSGLIEFFHTPTITDNGTQLISLNYNGESSNTFNGTTYYDPTITVDGSIIFTDLIGANEDKKLGGGANPEDEFVLKHGMNYIIKFTPDENDARVSMNISIYEEIK